LKIRKLELEIFNPKGDEYVETELRKRANLLSVIVIMMEHAIGGEMSTRAASQRAKRALLKPNEIKRSKISATNYGETTGLGSDEMTAPDSSSTVTLSGYPLIGVPFSSQRLYSSSRHPSDRATFQNY